MASASPRTIGAALSRYRIAIRAVLRLSLSPRR
jgi:hypothetical protein